MTLTELKETEQVETGETEQKEQEQKGQKGQKVQEEQEKVTEQAATPLTSKKSSCLFASTMRHSLPTATWW